MGRRDVVSGVVRAALVAAGLAASCAWAQNPFIEAARPDLQEHTGEPANPADVVRAFVDGCVLTEGDATRAVDWALTAGFVPLDNYSDPQQLLGGQPGTVLAMGGSHNKVILAVTYEKRCTVWAEHAVGPAVRAAFRQSMSGVAGKTGSVQTTLDRNVERAGAWRQQVQMRYRRTGGAQDFGVGAVTTLSGSPSTQVLNLAPATAAATRDPDGLGVRQ
jgi:hypothetical protein